MAGENPNGANQYQPDPRQTEFLRLYLDPKSETYSNALQSALKAGYSQEYAESITVKGTEWMAEAVGRRVRILNKAEKRLETLLDSEDEKVVADLVKHTTKTLGKEYYSEKKEFDLTSKGEKLGNSDEIKELTQKLNEVYRRDGVGSDGRLSSPMGDKTQD